MSDKKYDLYLKGYVGAEDFDSDYIDYVVDRDAEKELNVLINSLGGSLNAGLTIASAFHRHGNVNVHFSGMNASAATLASLGAKHISIDCNAMYLVHKVLIPTLDWGLDNADTLAAKIEEYAKTKEDLDKMDLSAATMYAKKCNKPAEDLLDLMSRGGWLTAQEALEWGFVDEVTEWTTDQAPALTEDVVEAIVASGYPMPPVMERKAESLLDKIKDFLSGIFASTPALMSAETPSPVEEEIAPVDSVEIPADLLTYLDAEEGHILTAEDFAKLSALVTSEASLAAKVKELEAKVEELEDSVPADETTGIINEGHETPDEADVDPVTRYLEVQARANELLKSIS